MPARNVSVDYLRRRIEVLTEELERKLAAESIKDTFKDGDVLRINKTFPHKGTEYTFVLLKANGSWYNTSQPHVLSSPTRWATIVEFFGPEELMTAQRATTWKKAF